MSNFVFYNNVSSNGGGPSGSSSSASGYLSASASKETACLLEDGEGTTGAYNTPFDDPSSRFYPRPQPRLNHGLVNSQIQLRFLNPGDYDIVKALCESWFPVEYPAKWFESITSDTNLFSLAAILDGKIIGKVIIYNTYKELIDFAFAPVCFQNAVPPPFRLDCFGVKAWAESASGRPEPHLQVPVEVQRCLYSESWRRRFRKVRAQRALLEI
jgi:hypothetical protein